MALIDKLVKIEGYKGLYFKDDKKVFSKKEVKVTELRKIKPPYSLVTRFYQGKKAVYKTHHITDMSTTIKKICDEIYTNRQIKQINKSFTTKQKVKKLDDVFSEWIEQRSKTISLNHYKVTKWNYQSHIKGSVGHKKINEITSKQIQSIINHMLENGKAPRTTKSIKDVLSPVFEYAMKNDYCTKNPAKSIELPKFDNQRYFEIELEDAKRLYKTLTEYPDITIRGIFVFLAHGRRKMEVLNLKWEDINLKAKTYTLTYDKNKSRKNLTFPLSESQEKALKDIGIIKSGYVFVKDDNEPYKDIRHHWEKVKKELGVDIRLHDLRHLIGFIAVNAGIPLEAISKTLGHSNIQITQRYSNVKNDNVSSTLRKVLSILS